MGLAWYPTLRLMALAETGARGLGPVGRRGHQRPDCAGSHRRRHGAAGFRPDPGHVPAAGHREGVRVFGPAIGMASILGPIAAGLLIRLDGLLLIFLINVPLGVAAIAVGARFLPAVAPAARNTRLDLTGTWLAGGAMFLLVYPLVEGRQLGWPGWIFGMLACSVPAPSHQTGGQAR